MKQSGHPKRFLVHFKKCIHCGQLILRKISKIGVYHMSDFKAKMHQIRFPLGLCPNNPAGGAYSAPQTP